MSKELERDIQKSIIDYLSLKGYFFMKVNTVGIFKQATGSYIPSQSVGAPDILVFLDGGVCMAIEVKTSIGKLSPHQEAWKSRSKAIGMDYVVCRSIDDVIKAGL